MNENEISSEGYATQRQWENIKAENTWEIFKYISEFVEVYRDWETDRKSTRLNSSHITRTRMPSSA